MQFQASIIAQCCGVKIGALASQVLPIQSNLCFKGPSEEGTVYPQ